MISRNTCKTLAEHQCSAEHRLRTSAVDRRRLWLASIDESTKHRSRFVIRCNLGQIANRYLIVD